MERDVVCGIQIDPAKAACTSEYNGNRRRHGRANIARCQPKEKHHE
jgi:hypothetical protein